jgi:hypothetical protein
MASNRDKSSSGLPLVTIHFVVFLVLKLTHVITWSWWWVTAPLWISFAVCLLVIGVAAYIEAATSR